MVKTSSLIKVRFDSFFFKWGRFISGGGIVYFHNRKDKINQSINLSLLVMLSATDSPHPLIRDYKMMFQIHHSICISQKTSIVRNFPFSTIWRYISQGKGKINAYFPSWVYKTVRWFLGIVQSNQWSNILKNILMYHGFKHFLCISIHCSYYPYWRWCHSILAWWMLILRNSWVLLIWAK